MKPRVGPHGGLQGSSILKGTDFVLGADLGGPVVANHSWGVYGCQSPLKFCGGTVGELIKQLNKGVAVVWAAGNAAGKCGVTSQGSLWCFNSTPESYSVGALNRNLRPQPYSSPGPGQCFPFHPTVAAPTYGVLPWGRAFSDFGELGGGTSSAAPQVTGALALMMAASPDASNKELRNALRAGASNFQKLGIPMPYNRFTGFGLLQIESSFKNLPGIKRHPFYFFFP